MGLIKNILNRGVFGGRINKPQAEMTQQREELERLQARLRDLTEQAARQEKGTFQNFVDLKTVAANQSQTLEDILRAVTGANGCPPGDPRAYTESLLQDIRLLLLDRPNRARRVLIAGFYGFGNTGDEAMLTSLVQGLRSLDQKIHITVFSENPSETEKAYDVRAVSWRLGKSAMACELAACDLLLVGGGAILSEGAGFDPLQLKNAGGLFNIFILSLALEAAQRNTPYALIGVSVVAGEHPAFRDCLKRIADHARIVAVRDEKSKRYLLDAGASEQNLKILPDPAFFMPTLAPEAAQQLLQAYGISTENRPILAVTLIHYGSTVPSWAAEIALALDRWVEKTGGHIVFLPFYTRHEHSDEIIMRAVLSTMTHAERVNMLPDELSPAQKAEIIARSNVLLGMRYHSLIFALKAGIPAVSLTYDNNDYRTKIPSLMAAFGRGEFSLSIEEVSADKLVCLLQDVSREEIPPFTQNGNEEKQVWIEIIKRLIENCEENKGNQSRGVQ